MEGAIKMAAASAKRRTDSNDSTAHLKRTLNYHEHDDVCDRRLGWMKTAIWLIIGTIALGGGYGYTQGEGMQTKNATQDENIIHNEKAINKLEQKFDQHLHEQRNVNKEMLQILNQLKTDIVVIKQGVSP